MGELAPTVPSQPPAAAEAGSLARELARAFLRMRDYYRREMAPADADARASDPAGDDVERIAETPPHEISWWTLGRLAAVDPERAQAAWERILAEARDELESGHRSDPRDR